MIKTTLIAVVAMAASALADVDSNLLAALDESTPRAPATTPIAQSEEREQILPNTVIIGDGENWALVPSKAILHLPASFKGRVNVKPIGNLLPWNEFAKENETWVLNEQFTLREAEGIHPVDPRRKAFLFNQNKLVMAVRFDTPIAVADRVFADEIVATR